MEILVLISSGCMVIFNILLMGILNRDINVLNSDCDMVLLYNINCRLSILIDKSWSTGDVEFKFF